LRVIDHKRGDGALLNRGAYLGPHGRYQAHPHYFALERIVTNQGALFRAGPELAAHMQQFNRVEICSDDEWLREEGVWGELEGLSARGAAAGAMRRAPEPDRGFDYAAANSSRLPRGTSDAAVRGMAIGFVILVVAAIGYILAPDIRCTLSGSCGSAALDDERRLERAGSAVAQRCAAGKSQAGDFCSVEECIAPYRAQFPDGPATEGLNRIAWEASDECNKTRQHQQRAEARGVHAGVALAAQTPPETVAAVPSVTETAGELDAAALFSAARQCADANPCLAPACFAEIRKRFAADERASEVRNELSRASRRCAANPTASLPDGVYNGRAMPGCGAPQQFGVRIKVQTGSIAWQHEVPLSQNGAPVAVQWNGTIDGNGNIRATARSSAEFQASGRYHGEEREIAMHYTGCVAMLSILGRLK
jgi:hypothetical protein